MTTAGTSPASERLFASWRPVVMTATTPPSPLVASTTLRCWNRRPSGLDPTTPRPGAVLVPIMHPAIQGYGWGPGDRVLSDLAALCDQREVLRGC